MKLFGFLFLQFIFLLQTAITANISHDLADENIKDFVIRYLIEDIKNKEGFLSATKGYLSYLDDHMNHLEETSKKIITDYIDIKAKNNQSLIAVWFDDVKFIENSDTFPRVEYFIKYWNQVIRDNLDMCIYGNNLRGYLDQLHHKAFDQLKEEVHMVLSEWENEKHLGGVGDTLEQNEALTPKKSKCVFKKPISVIKLVNVKGSHEKYLLRDENSNLFFKIVVVRPHGTKTSVPKPVREKQTKEKIENNLERKANYVAPEVMPQKTKKPVDKIVAKTSVPMIDKGLKSKLHSYSLIIDPNSLELKKCKDTKHKIALGDEYFKRMPDSVKEQMLTMFNNVWGDGKNYPWLDNFDDGKNLFCYHVVTEQEKQLSTQALLEQKNAPKPVPIFASLQNDSHQNPKIKPASKKTTKIAIASPPKKVIKEEEPKIDPDAIKAIGEKNIEALLKLLEERADINSIKEFVKNNKYINITENNGKKMFMSAVNTDNFEVVEFIFNKFKKHLNFNPARGEITPIIVAIDKKRVDMVKFFIDFDIGVYSPLSNGTTSLMFACMNGEINIVKLLLDKHKKNNNKSIDFINAEFEASSGVCGKYTALMFAVQKGYLEIVNFLLLNGAKIDKENSLGETVLAMAAKSLRNSINKAPFYEIIQNLLKAGADPNLYNKKTEAPAFLSALYDLRLMKIMLNYRADFADKKNAVLAKICSGDMYGEMNQLTFIGLSKFVSLESKKEALFYDSSSINEHNKLMKSKMDEMSKISEVNKIAEKIQTIAAAKEELLHSEKKDFRFEYDKKHEELVRIKKAIESKLEKRDLYFNLKLIEEFNGLCLDPEMDNNTRRINFGNLVDRSLRDINDRILFAIENQVDPNIQSITTKKTALHFMAESGNLEAVRMLLKSGADSILIDANNLTAKDCAEKGKTRLIKSHEEYLAIVQQAPGDQDLKNEEIKYFRRKFNKLISNFNEIIKLLP